MIEAVNSTLATSSVTKGVAEQQSSANSFAANPERVQRIALAPYVSPYISMDTNFDRAVLQIRDSDTGDVLNQYPTESQLQAYRRAQQVEQQTVQFQPRSDSAEPRLSRSEPSQQDVQEAQAAIAAQQQTSAPVTEAISVNTQA